MGLPVWLNVRELASRADVELSGNDALFAEKLEAALLQAQAPPPFGSGRLLLPDPAPEPDESGVDQSTPTTRSFHCRRRCVMPDAREVTKVEVDGVETTEYELFERDGVAVQLRLTGLFERRWGYYDDYLPFMRPRRHRRRKVVVTGRFGFIVPPKDLVEAIYTLAARAFYERQSEFADTVVDAQGAPVQSYFRQLPAPVKLTFATYALAAGYGELA